MKAISSPELSSFPSKGSRPPGNESYCRSRGGLSANQKEEHFASNDNGRGRRVDGLKSTSPFVDSLVQNVSKDVEQQNEAGKRAQKRLIL